MCPTKKLKISSKFNLHLPKLEQKWPILWAKMVWLLGKNDLNFGAKRVQLQKPAIDSKQLPKSAKNNLGHRWYTIGSRRGAMGVWSGPIGLKAKDPYWGGMGI